FQWQRELKEKFDEKFLVLKGGDIRDQFGVNQWLEQKQVITSLDLAKRTEILPGLRQVPWDLVVVDEAHRMSCRHRHARRRAMLWANYCATAPTTSCCSRLRRTKAIRKILRCSSSCSIPMPTPTFDQFVKRWSDKGHPSTSVASRRRWCISR